MDQDMIIESVERWLQSVVVGLNLCPFAAVPLARGAVRFVVAEGDTVESLLHCLNAELNLLQREPQIETTLLIHPRVLVDFMDYNQFLNLADNLLAECAYEGVFQIASFHPDYQFAGTAPDDAENYSNRSPYPMLHLLREESVERAVAAHADPENIPVRNIRQLNEVGVARLRAMLSECSVGKDR